MLLTRKIDRLIFATIASLIIHAQVNAETQTLSCKLFNASTTANETMTQVKLENSAQTLTASRTASVCLFEDGSMADKQFVNVQRALNDGAIGIVSGISVYTLENGDSITATFTGDWGSSGFIGAYTIIDGTGIYESAKGDGTFTGAESPWKTTAIFDVVLNVTTP